MVEVPERATQWWDVPLRFLADRLGGVLAERDRASAELDVAHQGSAQRDPRTGLLTTAYLERWTSGLGAGTLPIGLVVLRLLDVEQVRAKYGMRVELATLQTVARILHELTTDADRVIRLDRTDFLLVLPGWQLDAVRDLGRNASARIARMDQWYPFVTLRTVASATVTRRRPLPIGQLLQEVSGSREENVRLVAG